MTDPQRLLYSSELPLDLRHDLNVAKGSHPYDSLSGFDRFSEHLGQSVSAPQGPGGSGLESSHAPATQLAHASYWGLGAIGLGIAVLVAGGLVRATATELTDLVSNSSEKHSSLSEQTATQRQQVPDPSQDRSRLTGQDPRETELTALAPKPVPGLEQAELERTSQVKLKPAVTVMDRPSLSLNEPLSLKEEVDELKTIRGFLISHPAEALRRINTSLSTGRGALEPERQVVRIEALMRLNQEAQAKIFAQKYLVRYPDSPAASHLRCLVDPNGPSCQASH